MNVPAPMLEEWLRVGVDALIVLGVTLLLGLTIVGLWALRLRRRRTLVQTFARAVDAGSFDRAERAAASALRVNDRAT